MNVKRPIGYATERIEIVVSETGAQNVKRRLDDIGNSAKRSGGLVQVFGRLLAVVFAAQTIRAIGTLVQRVVEMENKIRDVTRTTNNFNATMNELYNIARDTRTSVADTADTYQRLDQATQQLGMSQRETLDLTRTLNQALIVEGTNAGQARAAIDALVASLNAGEVGIRQVQQLLKNSPILAEALSESLGVTTARLMEMAKNGEISGRELIEALGGAADEIQERFENMEQTVPQALQRLGDNVGRLFAQVLQDGGALSGLVDIINAVADEFERLATSDTVTWFDYLVSTVNEFIKLLGQLGGVIGDVFGFFTDQLEKLGLTWGDVGNFFAMVLDTILAAFVASAAAIYNSWRNMINGIGSFFAGMINGVQRGIEVVVNGIRSAQQMLGQEVGPELRFQRFEASVSNTGLSDTEAFNGVFDRLRRDGPAQRHLRRIQEGAEARAAERRERAGGTGISDARRTPTGQTPLGEGGEEAARQAKRFAEFLRDLEKENELLGLNQREREIRQVLLQAEDVLNRQLTESERELVQGLAEENQLLRDAEVLREYNRNMQQQNELLGLNAQERQVRAAIFDLENQLGRQLTDTERAQVESLERQNIALEEQARAYERIQGPRQNLEQSMMAVEALFRSGRISAEQYAQAVREIQVELSALDNTIEGGVRNGLARINLQINNIGEQVSNTFVQAFEDATDAVVEFARTGDLSLRNFFDGIISQITRMYVQQYITGPIFNAIGNSMGQNSMFSGRGYQFGGDFTVGGSGGIDSQMVAFRATPGERVTVTRPSGPSPNTGGTVQMNIYTQDANSFQRSQGQIMKRTQTALARAAQRNN